MRRAWPASGPDRITASASALPATAHVHPVGSALRSPLAAISLLKVYSLNVVFHLTYLCGMENLQD